MNGKAIFSLTIGLVAWLACGTGRVLAFEEGYGGISGQFVLDGDIPKPMLLVQKGAVEEKVKDSAICAANNIEDESLVVDPASKGIANIFVYLRTAPKIHPSLKVSKEKTVVFDQKGCHFIPHALLVRTDQVVLVKSGDPVAHNTNTTPLRNTGKNEVVRANDREGVEYPVKVPELQPIPVKCDFHTWMKANWLILNHPYAAITDKQGKFQLDKLPAGDYEFFVWHERKGYLSVGAPRGFKVTVKSDGSTDIGVKNIPVASLQESK